MITNGELQLIGLDQLAGIPESRILLVGFEVDRSPEGRALLSVYPGAIVVSLDDESKRPLRAGRAVTSQACDVVIAVQNYRKLKLLTFASRAKQRFVLVHGRLLPIHGTDLMSLLAPPAQRALDRARKSLEYPKLPEPIGAGNDFSLFEERAIVLAPRWPRIRASVIVPVYNRKAVLSKTLAALTLQTYPRELFEVIIADDGSRDRPDELIPLYRDRLDLRYVFQDDLGYRLAEVRNLAIEAAKGEVIVSLDCDMLPEPRFLESHLRWFHAAEERMVVIGYRKFVDTEHLAPQDILQNFETVRGLPETLAPAAIRRPEAPTKDWRVATFETTRFLRDHPAPYLFASGGNVAYRKREAIAAGLYSPKYQKWGGEDVDFGYRLERLGCWFVAEPGALAYHQDHPSAVVREEDQQVTRQILGKRVPRLRAYTTAPVAEYELPMITVVKLGEPTGIDEQTCRDFEVVTAIDPADALARAHGEFLLVLQPQERLLPPALFFLSAQLRRDSRLSFVFGGVRAQDGEMLPRRYSRLAHLMGEYAGCPVMMRVRDIHRAGGFGPSLYDLTLRLADVGRGEAHELLLMSTEHPRALAAEDYEPIARAAIDRLGLDWSARGWPAKIESRESGIESAALKLRQRLIAR